MLTLAFNLLGWYSCNSFFNVLNKQALNLFPYPWVVAWLQLFAGVALIAPAWLAGLRTAPKVDAQFLGANFLPMGLLHSTGHAAQVFSFWVSSDECGTSGGYMAAGGPGFAMGRDRVCASA